MKSLASIVLSLILLAGTLQIRLDMHLCQGHIKDVALWGEAQPCEHAGSSSDAPVEDNAPACPFHSPKSSEDGCCDDREMAAAFVDVTSIVGSSVEITVPTGGLLQPPAMLLHESRPEVWPKKTKYLNYKPPLIHQDIPVFIQIFLI